MEYSVENCCKNKCEVMEGIHEQRFIVDLENELACEVEHAVLYDEGGSEGCFVYALLTHEGNVGTFGLTENIPRTSEAIRKMALAKFRKHFYDEWNIWASN